MSTHLHIQTTADLLEFAEITGIVAGPQETLLETVDRVLDCAVCESCEATVLRRYLRDLDGAAICTDCLTVALENDDWRDDPKESGNW